MGQGTFDITKYWPYIKPLVLIICGLIISRVLKKFQKKIFTQFKIETVAHDFIRHLIVIVVWTVILLSCASTLGIKIDSFLTVLATAGAAIALSIQDGLANLFGGLMVMLSNLYEKGDYIACSGVEGFVESTDLLHTTVVTMDNKIITIPNATINKSILYNFSKSEKSRIEFKIGISYESDSEQARYVLVEMAQQDKRILSDPAPTCHVTEYADSAVILSLKVWVTYHDYWDVTHYLKDHAKAFLSEAGVILPYPQLDVHFDKERVKQKLK